MKKHTSCFWATRITILFALIFPVLLVGQPIWLNQSHQKAVALEILKPDFANINNTFLTSVLFLSMRAPCKGQASFVAELPFSHLGVEYRSILINGSVRETENAFGNPYVGVEIGGENSSVFGEIGLRLPLAPEGNDAADVASIVESVERLEAFYSDILPISGMLNYRYESPSHFFAHVRGGPSFWIVTARDDPEVSADDAELFALYHARLGYESRAFGASVGVSGRLLTTSDRDFDTRSLHQIGFTASAGLGEARLGLQGKLPLDEDVKNIYDFVIGLSLTWQFQ